MDIDKIIQQVTQEVLNGYSFQGGTKGLASYVDHTILKPDAGLAAVKKVCDEAKENRFASVCVNPSYIGYVAKELEGSSVAPCCVVGFPLGATMPKVKAFETESCIEVGAKEIDMVINIGAIKNGEWNLVKEDIGAVVKASRGRALVKVIIETCLLTDEEKVKACVCAKLAGADFVKTSTGFSTGGATEDDVALMRKTVGDVMGVKASGGVKTKADAENMIAKGATRLGTSSGIAIANGSVDEHQCINCGKCDAKCPSNNVRILQQAY